MADGQTHEAWTRKLSHNSPRTRRLPHVNVYYDTVSASFFAESDIDCLPVLLHEVTFPHALPCTVSQLAVYLGSETVAAYVADFYPTQRVLGTTRTRSHAPCKPLQRRRSLARVHKHAFWLRWGT